MDTNELNKYNERLQDELSQDLINKYSVKMLMACINEILEERDDIKKAVDVVNEQDVNNKSLYWYAHSIICGYISEKTNYNYSMPAIYQFINNGGLNYDTLINDFIEAVK